MPKRIVYTRPDGGVSICAPSLTALRFMTCGGGRWAGFDPGFLDRQIAKQAEECGEHAAHRFVMAMQFGGCTTAEAYDVMRDRFCAYLGSGCELWDISDIPTDRWFRNAWVRSHNGGPINIHLPKAKAIQLRKLRHMVAVENDRRRREDRRPLEPDWGVISDTIMRASDVDELRRLRPLVAVTRTP